MNSHHRGIVEKMFLKFNALFLVLTSQIIYQYLKPEAIWEETQHDATFEIS